MMKKLVFLIVLMFPVYAGAEAPTNIVWSPELLDFVKQGNLKKGEKLAQNCIACHGDKGISPMADYPSLAGQLATYTYKQLRDYADGHRTHVLMNSVAQGLSEQDSADLAVWFASLRPKPAKANGKPLVKAKILVSKGNGKKIIPPCFVCHGRHGEGEKQDIPALAGQQPGYFINTLTEYKTGRRHNDIYSRMRLISEQLSEEDISQLAQYYYQLK